MQLEKYKKINVNADLYHFLILKLVINNFSKNNI